MLTRAKVRHALTWCGITVGAGAAAGYLFCLFGSLTCLAGTYMLAVGDGDLIFKWKIVPMPGVAGGPPPAPNTSISIRRPDGQDWAWLPRWTAPVAGLGVVPFPGTLTIPLWIPLGIGLFSAYRRLPPGAAPGRCPKCDYNLRGVPKAADGSRRCPECGTIDGRADKTAAS